MRRWARIQVNEYVINYRLGDFPAIRFHFVADVFGEEGCEGIFIFSASA